MKRVHEIGRNDVVIMTADAVLINTELACLIDDITQHMAHDEIVARLKEIRETSDRLYTKLKGILNNGEVIWKP